MSLRSGEAGSAAINDAKTRRGSPEALGSSPNIYKSLHVLLQNHREDRRNVLENILYELLQKLLSFENADVEYKNNLSKILK